MNAQQIIQYAEISYRQLDYWCRQGYIKAEGPVGALTGSGTPREFTAVTARKARVMSCLINLGFEVKMAEKLAHLHTFDKQRKIYIGHGVTMLIEKHKHNEEGE